MQEIKVIKVSKSSDPMKVAGSVRYFVLRDEKCQLHVMGPQAINIATKALAQLLSTFKFEYTCVIEYLHFIGTNEKAQTGIKYTIFKK